MPLTRRELGAFMLASAAVKGNTGNQPLEMPGLDPVDWTRQMYANAPLQLTFKAETKGQAQAWQRKLRPKIAELVGGFPTRKNDLKARVLETRDFPGYQRERFVIESRPGNLVAGWLLTPKEGKKPYATVICIPGHGRGVDDLVGIDADGKDRTNKAGYQHDYALQAVEKGLAAVAIEPMAFGCRRDERTKKKGAGTSACQPTAGAALLLGQTMIGWRVYDVMRTIDYIETRPDLDAKRVACLGISGGGTNTLFASALDTRIKAAYVSGYLNTFRDSILSLSHCIDNYVPGILNWAEMYDVAGLIAPRPLFAESGDKDPIFPVAAAKESFAKTKRVYDLMGGPTEHEVFDGEHVFWGRRGWDFLLKHL